MTAQATPRTATPRHARGVVHVDRDCAPVLADKGGVPLPFSIGWCGVLASWRGSFNDGNAYRLHKSPSTQSKEPPTGFLKGGEIALGPGLRGPEKREALPKRGYSRWELHLGRAIELHLGSVKRWAFAFGLATRSITTPESQCCRLELPFLTFGILQSLKRNRPRQRPSGRTFHKLHKVKGGVPSRPDPAHLPRTKRGGNQALRALRKSGQKLRIDAGLPLHKSDNAPTGPRGQGAMACRAERGIPSLASERPTTPTTRHLNPHKTYRGARSIFGAEAPEPGVEAGPGD